MQTRQITFKPLLTLLTFRQLLLPFSKRFLFAVSATNSLLISRLGKLCQINYVYTSEKCIRRQTFS